MSDVIRLERRDGVALITLNRPDARNALNMELAQAVVDTIASAQDTNAIVLTGEDPAFCAGLDLRNLGIEKLTDIPGFIDAARESNTPIIAAVNGAAVTGGLELALACDFIVASEKARFADTHLRVGVYPGPVMVELSRRVGIAKAKEMSMTGNFVDAETALRIGLANHVVPHDELISFSLNLASAIAEQDPKMIRAMRNEWNELPYVPINVAYIEHYATAKSSGFGNSSGSDIAGKREEVISRAKKQI